MPKSKSALCSRKPNGQAKERIKEKAKGIHPGAAKKRRRKWKEGKICADRNRKSRIWNGRRFSPMEMEGGLRLDVFEAVKAGCHHKAGCGALWNPCRKERHGVLPFHKDKTPSLKADRRFHCFGCQADGDVIDFCGKALLTCPAWKRQNGWLRILESPMTTGADLRQSL